MPTYKVSYSGYYIIEADSVDEAMNTCRDDYEAQYEEWQNDDAEEIYDD